MRILTFISLCAIYLISFADNYFKPGMVWETLASIDGSDLMYKNFQYYLKESEPIKGRETYALYWKYAGDTKEERLRCYVSSEGEKVYVACGQSQEWELMYDFSLKEGDACNVWMTPSLSSNNYGSGPFEMVCEGLSRVETKAGSVEILNIRDADDPNPTGKAYWIQGIG